MHGVLSKPVCVRTMILSAGLELGGHRLPQLRLMETITKWGLRGVLLLVYIPPHPRVPATKCRAQIVV